MKVIDLLNKIANGEEVPKFIVCEDTYYLGKNGFLREQGVGETQWYIDKTWLNEEVEIIEEDKKIEKLVIGKDDVAWCEGNMKTDEEMVDIVLEIKDKINEIIDYLEKEIK